MRKTPLISIELSILSHPWYQKWECGELPVESLRQYAQDYYWQVANFPRYLSLLHSQLENLSDRQTVLRNLNDEENETTPHPELWLDFAESLGASRENIKVSRPSDESQTLVDKFRAIVGSSPEAGLGAILAYESQVPEVAKFKSKALRTHYLTANDQNSEKGTQFFAVHEKADVWHTEELESIVARLPEEKKKTAQLAANQACRALWAFLDQMPH